MYCSKCMKFAWHMHYMGWFVKIQMNLRNSQATRETTSNNGRIEVAMATRLLIPRFRIQNSSRQRNSRLEQKRARLFFFVVDQNLSWRDNLQGTMAQQGPTSSMDCAVFHPRWHQMPRSDGPLEIFEGDQLDDEVPLAWRFSMVQRSTSVLVGNCGPCPNSGIVILQTSA